jgi:hypothetical protein
MQLSIWARLGLPATRDRTAIRRAYAQRLKGVNPEDDAEGFQALRAAYEQALHLANSGAPLTPPDESDDDAPARIDPDDRIASETAATPKRPQTTPIGRFDDLCRRLERLVRSQAEPDPADAEGALAELLASEALDDIGVYLRGETWLAILIAENPQRGNDLIEAAVDRFGWSESDRDLTLHPAIVALLRRRIRLRRVKALEALEALAAAPEPPTEAALNRALNDVTPEKGEDFDLYRHTEGELCRLILDYAPRLDDVIGAVAERLVWSQRAFDPRVPDVLRRRDVLLEVAKLASRSHRLHAAFQSLKKPPGPLEALHAAVRPGRYRQIKTLLAQLEARLPEVLAGLPPAAVGAWRRYYQRLRVNPFTLTLIAGFVLLITTCQFQASADRAQMVARYYPAAALRRQIAGQVLLRCGPYGPAKGFVCRVTGETPGAQGFGAAAMRMTRDGHLGDLSVAYNSPRYEIDEPVYFLPKAAFGAPEVRIGTTQPVMDQPVEPSPESAAEPPPPLAGQVTRPPMATLRCHRGADGRLSACVVKDEEPTGQGVGETARWLAEQGVIRPPAGAANIEGTDDVEFWATLPAPVQNSHLALKPGHSGPALDLSSRRRREKHAPH